MTGRDNLLFYEETGLERKAFCPIVHFLGLALANDVFVDLSLSSLADRVIPVYANLRSFIVREDKKSLPICRMFTGPREGRVTSASSSIHQFEALGKRCGYKETTSGYCFRREFANGIDGMGLVYI